MREVIGESTEGRGEVTCPSSHTRQLDSRASGSYPLLCAASPSDRKLLYPLLLGASPSSFYLTLVVWSIKGPGAQDYKAHALTLSVHTLLAHSPHPQSLVLSLVELGQVLLFWPHAQTRLEQRKQAWSYEVKWGVIPWQAGLQDLWRCSHLIERLGPECWALSSLRLGF